MYYKETVFIVDSEKYFDNLPANTLFVIKKRKIGKRYHVRFLEELSEVIATSLADLRKELKAKCGNIKPDIMLDDDHTIVDSERFFNSLPENTIFFVEKKSRSPSPYESISLCDGEDPENGPSRWDWVKKFQCLPIQCIF